MSNAPPLFEIEPFRAEALEGEGEMGRRRRSASPSASLTRTRKPWLPRPRPHGPRGGRATPFDGYAPDGAFDPAPEPASAPEAARPSEYVRWVQFTLNRALGARLPVDGVMRANTRGALRAFQRRQGLPVSGFIGPDTRNALSSVSELGSSGADLESEWAPGTHLYKPEACKPFTFMREQTIDDAVTFLRNNTNTARQGVYILTVPGKGWYVGSTMNYFVRLAAHKRKHGNVVVRLLPMNATECQIRNCECQLIAEGLRKRTVTNLRSYELEFPFT